jgi:hypothetical protein
MNPEMSVVGYCRSCGKALDETTVRRVQGSLYCEEHAPAAPEPGSPYAAPVTTPTAPVPNTGVSPGLAFLLGLIPGVGAIYNGQYAKGIVHVVILGLLLSIASASNDSGLEPLLGMLSAAFWFYMAFEAYHTAKKRQIGQPVDEFSSIVPMRGHQHGTVVMPVVLIGAGVIFLMNNLGVWRLREVLRFWPVALIALGAYLLYVRVSGASAVSQATAREVSHERN